MHALFVALALVAAQPAAVDGGPCRSPRQAAATFLGNLQQDTDEPARAARCVVVPPGMGPDARDTALRALKATLDASGAVIRLVDLPDDAGYVDEKTYAPSLVLSSKVPRLRVTRDERGEWRVPADVVRDAEAIYAHAVPFDVAAHAKRLPASFQQRWSGLHAWQWLGLLLIVGLGVLARVLVGAVVRGRAIALARKAGLTLPDDELRRAVRMAGNLAWCGVAVFAIPSLSLPSRVASGALGVVKVVASFVVVSLLLRLIDLGAAYWLERAATTESRMDDNLVPLARRMGKLVVLSLGLVLVLQTLGIDVGSLVAGLGIGGLAVALAAKDTLANFIGGVAIYLDRPFQVGDYVVADSVDGVVEHVGFRSTRVRTVRDSVMTVPNAKLADSNVDNWGERRHRRFRFVLGFSYEVTPQQLQAFVDAIRALLQAREHVRQDDVAVHVHELTEAAVQVLIAYYETVSTSADELRARHDVLTAVLGVVDRLEMPMAPLSRATGVRVDAKTDAPTTTTAVPPAGV